MDKLKDLSSEDLDVLKQLQKQTLELERASSDGHFPELALQTLCQLLFTFQGSENESLRRLAEIPDHLHPKMSLRHFLNFMIPIERAVGRSLREDEFLIQSLDKTREPQASPRLPLVLILENIRSAFNVGSIFRMAEGLGVEAIHLCGYTPLPESKTALGTEKLVPYKSFAKTEHSLAELREQGYQIFALETAENSTSLYASQFADKTAFLVGNERFGLEAATLRLTAGTLSIPMAGLKNSLNVSNALAIVSFEWKRQWLKRQ